MQIKFRKTLAGEIDTKLIPEKRDRRIGDKLSISTLPAKRNQLLSTVSRMKTRVDSHPALGEHANYVLSLKQDVLKAASVEEIRAAQDAVKSFQNVIKAANEKPIAAAKKQGRIHLNMPTLVETSLKPSSQGLETAGALPKDIVIDEAWKNPGHNNLLSDYLPEQPIKPDKRTSANP
jgi:hypothetical protein